MRKSRVYIFNIKQIHPVASLDPLEIAQKLLKARTLDIRHVTGGNLPDETPTLGRGVGRDAESIAKALMEGRDVTVHWSDRTGTRCMSIPLV